MSPGPGGEGGWKYGKLQTKKVIKRPDGKGRVEKAKRKANVESEKVQEHT